MLEPECSVVHLVSLHVKSNRLCAPRKSPVSLGIRSKKVLKFCVLGVEKLKFDGKTRIFVQNYMGVS